MNSIRIFFALIFLNGTILCQNEEVSVIRVITNLTEKGKTIRNYKAIIVYEGKLKDTVKVVNSVPKYIRLEKNKVYTVFYKKVGAPEKLIIVDTNLPQEISDKVKIFNVHVNVELDSVHSKQKEDATDFPSAIVKYNEKSKNFEYVKNYHKQVHK
jgi:hypothetical protein